MSVFIDPNDAAFNLQLKNFVNKITIYSTVLGVSAADIASVKADSLAYDYTLNGMIAMQTFSHNYVEYKTELRHGTTQSLGAFPVMPTLSATPAVVLAGIEKRFRALLQKFVHSSAYTLAIGQDLGIVAPAANFDPSTGKPVFSIALIGGGHPELSYTRGEFGGVEIWKDSGSGFVVLQRVTQTTYTDNSPLPASGIGAVWKYKMIFLYKDLIVGSFSDVVSITVNG
jgi:hypothetical protein